MMRAELTTWSGYKMTGVRPNPDDTAAPKKLTFKKFAKIV
jgi:hypothetical protein